MSNKKKIEYAPTKKGGGFPFPIKDIKLPIRDCLRGNPLVKAAYYKQNLNNEQLYELLRCEEDPVYFIKTYCRITSVDSGIIPFEVFEYQEEIIKAFYENRFLCVAIHRQAGKCVTHNTFINIKNNRTDEEYYLPIGEYHIFIKNPEQHDISKFKLSRQNHINMSKLDFGSK